MVISCDFICVFVVLINKVSLQETVEAVIGGSVLLPCSSTKHDIKLHDINVHWRHNGKIVYDIVKGVETVSEQDHQYKNRAETFPEEYLRGNFSIKLTDLTHTDAGKYICFITPSDEHHTVQLIINESTAEKETISTEQENQGETEPDSVETSSPWLWVVIASGIIVIVIVIVIGFIACWKRKNSSSRRADRHDTGSDAHEDEHMNQ